MHRCCREREGNDSIVVVVVITIIIVIIWREDDRYIETEISQKLNGNVGKILTIYLQYIIIYS